MTIRRMIPTALGALALANAAVIFDLIPAALGQSGCPNETCLASYECGGQGGTRTIGGIPVTVPPGSMSLCTYDQWKQGDPCNWCDGMQSVRRCVGGSQTRRCTAPNSPTVCGMPKTGTCTWNYWPGVGTVYYCTGTAVGTQSCNMIGECTGDVACAGS